MLGAAAASEAAKGPIESQEDAAKRAREGKDNLWNIMVSARVPSDTLVAVADIQSSGLRRPR